LISQQDFLTPDEGCLGYHNLQMLACGKKHHGILDEPSRVIAAQFLTSIVRDIGSGFFATEDGPAILTGMKGAALHTHSKPRPILIGRNMLQLTGKFTFRQAFVRAVGLSQLGVGVSDGGEAAPRAAQAYVNLNHGNIILDTDASGAKTTPTIKLCSLDSATSRKLLGTSRRATSTGISDIRRQ
jgi:hypothetical protein